jgi:hypothetical protein
MLAATAEAPEALLFAGHAVLATGDLPMARQYFERGLAGAPAYERALGELALAWIRQQSDAEQRARDLTQDATHRLRKRWGGDPKRPEDYVDLVKIRVLEGDREGALRAMDEGVRQGWRFLNDHPNDPILNSLRGDPRYDRLMAEVKADVDLMRARVEREGW